MSVKVAALAGLAAVELAGGSALAQPFDAGVRVEHAAARLVVVAEPRGNVSVTVEQGSTRLPPLQVRREGGVIVVDGGLERLGGDGLRCTGGRGGRTDGRWFGAPVNHVRDNRAVFVEGVGRVDYEALPVITAHVPMDANLATAGAVWGEIGATDRLHLAAVGCGDWRVGPVRGGFDAQMTGSGDVSVASAGETHAHLAGSGNLDIGVVAGAAAFSLAGSGDIRTGAVTGPLTIDLAGSGDVDVAAARAPIQARIASSGDVRVRGGYAPEANVSLAGSGGFAFDGVAGRLSASVVGSGDVRVAHVTGSVSKSVIGSGEVSAGR